jgi:hypothetical protein
MRNPAPGRARLLSEDGADPRGRHLDRDSAKRDGRCSRARAPSDDAARRQGEGESAPSGAPAVVPAHR